MIWVRFALKDSPEPVIVKIPEGREHDVLNLADTRFGFNGTDEQRIARMRLGDSIIEKSKRERMNRAKGAEQREMIE